MTNQKPAADAPSDVPVRTGGQTQDTAALPDLLEYRIELGLGGKLSVSYTSGKLYYECGHYRFEKVEYEPPAAAWTTFWEAMDRLDVWSWKDRYEPVDFVVLDGWSWSLNMKRGARHLTTSGSNATPGGTRTEPGVKFVAFGRALGALVGFRNLIPQ